MLRYGKRQSHVFRWVTIVTFFLLLATSSHISIVKAQAHTTSLTIPETLAPIFRDVILPRFHKANPELFVELKTVSVELYQDLELPSSPDELEDYLEATNHLVNTADVHFMYSHTLSSENTRAGYFLDIAPLITTDTTLLLDDFVPSMRDAFTWDGGTWALPTVATSLVMVYDPDAFDKASLNYPTDHWTFDDFSHAARLLTSSESPGMQVTSFDLPIFLRIFSETNFTDGAILPHPQFNTLDLIELAEMWSELESEGVVTSGFNPDVPLRLARLSDLMDRKLRGSLIAGMAGADIYSVAISSGTNDVEAAYQLAMYLTTVPELATVTPTAFPVRYSVQLQVQDNPSSLPDDAISLRQNALENALITTDYQFGHYLTQALSAMVGGQSADVALQNAEISANEILDQVESIKDTIQVVVPLVSLPDTTQSTTIKFGLFTGSTQLANRSQWQSTIDEFVANHPTLDDIEFTFIPPTSGYWDEIPKHDCIFGYEYIAFSNDELLPLDPLLNADPTYDPDDVVGDVMRDMQRDGNTYAIPTSIRPYILRYEIDAFSRAGLPQPNGTWTINEFVDALNQLQAVSEGAPLIFYLNYSTTWELLMAAYGESPIDYTTSPPTLHLTDENSVIVIRQVLDLAKSSLIDYLPMATYFGNGRSQRETAPLRSEQLTDISSIDNLAGYGLVAFPRGTESTPLSYYVTSGFIFDHALYPEPCYQWLREITAHTELFFGMPAYHSIIGNATTAAMYGETGVATFEQFAEMMEAPNRVFIKPFGLGVGESMFMGRAFDRYVLEDADLERELALAQDLTELYRVCAAENPNTIDCLLEADPTIREQIEPRLLGNR